MKPIFLFLGGAAVGAIAALLLAPDSGEVTRKRVVELLKSKGLLPAGLERDIEEDGDELSALMAQISAEIKDVDDTPAAAEK